MSDPDGPFADVPDGFLGGVVDRNNKIRLVPLTLRNIVRETLNRDLLNIVAATTDVVASNATVATFLRQLPGFTEGAHHDVVGPALAQEYRLFIQKVRLGEDLPPDERNLG